MEARKTHLPRHWRKSTYSMPDGDCVECRPGRDHVLVRDSKNTSGGLLFVPSPGWDAFLAWVG